MVRRLRNKARHSLVILGLLLAAPSGVADIVWKIADEGPRAPGSVGIVGDDARVLASGTAGTWELDGAV